MWQLVVSDRNNLVFVSRRVRLYSHMVGSRNLDVLMRWQVSYEAQLNSWQITEFIAEYIADFTP